MLFDMHISVEKNKIILEKTAITGAVFLSLNAEIGKIIALKLK
jgi:hypothetical protein